MTAEEGHDKASLGAIGEAVHTLTRYPIRARMWGEALEEMPLAAVFFLASVGTPGETAEIESPVVLVLRSVQETLDGWASASSGSTFFAAVPKAEIDRLGYRIGLAIELARRGGSVRLDQHGEHEHAGEAAP